jgi:OHCU decarboxylase
MQTPVTLEALNTATRDAFVAGLGDIYEHSPWVAERAFAARPFASVAALHTAMLRAMQSAHVDEQLALIRAHPELAGREASAGTLTSDSTSEQRRLGFTQLTRAELDQMANIHRTYREKFGFPAIVALALHATRATVIAEMQRRTGLDRATEIANALDQIGHIANGRLDKKFATPNSQSA